MKNIYLFAIASATVISGFFACSNDMEEALVPKREIRLTSEIIPSRVTSLDCQSTQIAEGQQVGITVEGAWNVHRNVAWSVGKNGALTNTESPVFWGDTEVTITAYHPHHSAWTGTNHEFSVSTDQSSESGYTGSDLLWVSTTASVADTPVSLKFSHLLAKIGVTVSSEDFADLRGTTISICGTNITTGFNPSAGTLSPVDGSVAEIKASVTTDEAYTASAIIVPQTVAKGTKFIKLTRGNKTFHYTLPKDQTYQSGYFYHYKLNVEDTNVENPEEKEEIEW